MAIFPPAMTTPTPQTHSFQAAVSEVLRLVIHSLYSNKEIFLRELVSNASDAIDKLKFRAIAEPGLLAADEVPTIRLSADPEKRTLTLSDDGVGMTEAELVKNLGTVAHSGSSEFLKQLEAAKKGDVSLIGQFGVGFYSAYLVADRVDVRSRAAGSDEAFLWSSSGQDTFTVEPTTRASRGTDVILHLKEEHGEFLTEHRLRELVRRYSDFVAHPIELEVTRTEGSGDEAKTEKRWERVNTSNALWRRTTSEITEEQFQEFYRHLTHDWEAPLAHRHFKVEGTQEFSGILYLPKHPPFDLFSPEVHHGVRLHVKRVFIMDDCEELLPRWLRFVRGVVDSEDLPLNVSREILQDSRIVRTMQKQIVKRSLDMIEDLAKGEGYASFWKSFGAVLKEGLHFDREHKERLSKLVRFESTNGAELVSLDDYVGRMKPEQKVIYYVVGASRALVERAPHLEALKKRGYEVLLLVDPVDPFAIEGLEEYQGKKLVSAMEANLELEDEKGEATKQAEREELEPLRAKAKEVLADKVSDVRFTDRLTDSAACLVLPESGLPPYLERILRAQQGDLPAGRRALELNPEHPLVRSLGRMATKEGASDEVREIVELLYDQALLAEGSPVDDPSRLVKKLTSLLVEATARS